MSEISTEELARRLEFVADARRDGLFEVDKEELLQAAARLRALAEDAERLDWLEKAEMPVFRIDNGSRSDGVSLMPGWVCGSGFGIQSSQQTIRQAIDKARHD